VQSQIEKYRTKAKEFARLTVSAKSLRHSRQYRKFAEMYWALALGEELERAPSKNERQREQGKHHWPSNECAPTNHSSAYGIDHPMR
jgi:hypothetical protein